MTPSVAIVGAGAAGTMAAIFAARAGAHVTLIDRTRDGGRKILISGGGRCNVLPARLDESRFVTDSSPNTLRKIVRSWPLAEQIAFFERDLQLPLVEEPASAKLFPRSQRARDVRDALIDAALASGVTILFEHVVADVVPTGGRWRIAFDDGASLDADRVVLAAGGLSVPNTGSDGCGLRLAQRLGHVVHPTYPALTPVTCDAAPFAHLAGVSLAIELHAASAHRQARARGGFLFTHRGYSGPSVLDVSHVVTRARAEGDATAQLRVAWSARDAAQWDAAFQQPGKRDVVSVVRDALPERLALGVLALADVPVSRVVGELRREERRRLIAALVDCPLPWTGDEGYKKAEVTGGGVALSDIDPRTLQSRRCAGLFMCGEMLDAFGPIGGYNFLWAWATGRAAGLGAATAASA